MKKKLFPEQTYWGGTYGTLSHMTMGSDVISSEFAICHVVRHSNISSCSSWIWFHLLLYFEELALKYHDQDPYNNQLAAVQSQYKQACINMMKPGSVVYWEVTLFLNYIVRVWPLSLMLLNNLQWFSMTISNKVNATQWVCLKMEPLHTENRVARSKNLALGNLFRTLLVS